MYCSVLCCKLHRFCFADVYMYVCRPVRVVIWVYPNRMGKEGVVLKCTAVYCVVNYTGSVLLMYTGMCVDLYV